MRNWLSTFLAMCLAAPAAAQEEWAPEGEGAAEEGAAPVDTEVPPRAGGEYPIDQVSRPIVLPTGMGQVGLGFSIGLDKSAVGKLMGLGLGFDYGIMDNLQAGLGFGTIVVAPDPLGPGDLLQFALGGRYRVIDGDFQLAPSFDIVITKLSIPVPTTGASASTTAFAVAIGAPLKLKASDMFAIQAMHGFPGRAGLAGAPMSGLIYFGNKEQKGLVLPFGALVNATESFAIGLDLGIALPDFKADGKVVPLALSGAYSWSNMGDIGLAFGFDNLTPAAGGAADARYVQLFTRIRF